MPLQDFKKYWERRRKELEGNLPPVLLLEVIDKLLDLIAEQDQRIKDLEACL
tara:strand:- start:127 stop:282 length:156 start_codon:yes stop_codon:yes gene_type:complete